MPNAPDIDTQSRQIAQRWCEEKGPGWSVRDRLGEGGTAPVFEIVSPDGPRALKMYDGAFSAGEKGEIERKRIEQQLALRDHDCPSLVRVYDGGNFESRLYLLMSRAPGKELEKRLQDVPRAKIRHIADQVARAALFLRSKDLCHRDIKAANVFVSDDFSQVTLLDISVVRNIYDPIGVGTDHDGQLPVVATARYSPPEYLFRLLEPGPELWHALSIYQLGALLHDLIMKEPLFQSEYLKSAENRYRFAWVVATFAPRIQADDVDQDLVFTARRALDKEWKRRSALTLEDFLADSKVQEAHALQLVGLAGDQGAPRENDLAARLERVRNVASGLEIAVLEHLRKKGVTAEHFVEAGADDNSKLLTFRWNAPTSGADASSQSVELQLALSLGSRLGGYCFKILAKLSAAINGKKRVATMELPEIGNEAGADSILASQAESALVKLAVELTGAQNAR